MSDVLDRAKEIEMHQRNVAIQNQLDSAKHSENPIEFNGHRFCLDCDNEINTKRLLANPKAVRCIGCQEVTESKSLHCRRLR